MPVEDFGASSSLNKPEGEAAEEIPHSVSLMSPGPLSQDQPCRTADLSSLCPVLSSQNLVLRANRVRLARKG